MDIRAYSDWRPPFRVETFFAGQTRASGIFIDRFGKLRRQFEVLAKGRLDGDTLVLDEHFTYGDGATERRTWRIRPRGEHDYDASTDELVGGARGAAYGNVFNLNYTIRLDVGGRILPVRFDDWMFLQPDGVVINRANVSKFGLLLGQVNCAFWKVADDVEVRSDQPTAEVDTPPALVAEKRTAESSHVG